MTKKVPFDDAEVHVPLYKVYGGWLEDFTWSHYGILTSDEYLTCKEAWRKFNKWKRTMAKAIDRKIDYLFIYDTEHPDNPHLHVLLAGTEGIDVGHWAEEWEEKVGIVRKLVQYDPKKGARFYLGGKFLKDDAEIQIILSARLRAIAVMKEGGSNE